MKQRYKDLVGKLRLAEVRKAAEQVIMDEFVECGIKLEGNGEVFEKQVGELLRGFQDHCATIEGRNDLCSWDVIVDLTCSSSKLIRVVARNPDEAIKNAKDAAEEYSWAKDDWDGDDALYVHPANVSMVKL